MSYNPIYGLSSHDVQTLRHKFARMRKDDIPCEFPDLDSFLRWSADQGYQFGMKLERLDKDSPWSPENCRWSEPVVKGTTARHDQALALQWDEFVAPIRKRYRKELEEILGRTV